ncbi:hypothetical protein LAUMK7_05070 [Mycobacterium kansasii]|nr:hypothetical protein LAUMK22_04415 [Mycobacterium kansasii]VAZ69027.1 hypothetical protein LAUMK40_05183 [Mycobacterium kansasii]VAZ79915.1 hypothetical protein LAUMK7_05070 [Mycobacterium kansasii]
MAVDTSSMPAAATAVVDAAAAKFAAFKLDPSADKSTAVAVSSSEATTTYDIAASLPDRALSADEHSVWVGCDAIFPRFDRSLRPLRGREYAFSREPHGFDQLACAHSIRADPEDR